MYSTLFVGLLKYLIFIKYSNAFFPFIGCDKSVSIIVGTESISFGYSEVLILTSLNIFSILYLFKYANILIEYSHLSE